MKFKDIKSFNNYTQVREPKHELIDIGEYPSDFLQSSPSVYPDFYRISIKYGLEDEKEKGFMYFSSPNEEIHWKTDTPWVGYFINIREELITKYHHLEYSFLKYGLHEPLFLKKEEEKLITELFEKALLEYQKENFSMNILIAYCNLMFAHIAEFYERQFGERKASQIKLVDDFLALLKTYYQKQKGERIVQPSVNYFANKLHVTSNYLGDLVKFHTGQPAISHIHSYIIDTAKLMIGANNDSIAEIAYQLGFEYPNYFSRLFRKQTGMTPSKFRQK